MTFAAFLMLLAAVHVAVRWTDRGYRQHRRWSSPEAQLAALDQAEKCQTAGADVLPVSTFDMVKTETRSLWTYRQVVFRSLVSDLGVITGGWLVSLIPVVPPWIPALLVAGHTTFSAWLGREQLRARGDIKATDPRTRQSRLIEWPMRLVSGVGNFAAYVVLFSAPAEILGAGRTGVGWAALLALAVYTLLFAANSWERLGRRLAVLKYRVTFADDADERTILYLRSFTDDRSSLWFPFTDGTLRSVLWPRTSLEQTLSIMGMMEGNVVTVGDPRERLPLPGAYRVYYRHSLGEREDEWREAVAKTAKAARGVILIAGATPALAWEIEQLKQWGVLGKCLFVFPPDMDQGTEARRDALMAALGVPARARALARLVPVALLAGMGMRDDGRPISYTATGRDFRNYLLTLTCFLLALDTNYSDAFWADDVTANPEPSSVLAPRPKRPARPPAELRRVIRRAMPFWIAYQRDDHANALAKCEQVVQQLAGERLPIEAIGYLAYWHGLLLGANDRWTEGVSELDRARAAASGVPWMWVDPAETMTGQEFAYDCCEGIIEFLDALRAKGVGPVRRRGIAEEMVRLGTVLDDRRKTAKGHGELGYACALTGDLAAAAEAFATAAEMYQRLGDTKAADEAADMRDETLNQLQREADPPSAQSTPGVADSPPAESFWARPSEESAPQASGQIPGISIAEGALALADAGHGSASEQDLVAIRGHISACEQSLESLAEQIATLPMDRRGDVKRSHRSAYDDLMRAYLEAIRQLHVLLGQKARLALGGCGQWQVVQVDERTRRATLMTRECLVKLPLHHQAYLEALVPGAESVVPGWASSSLRHWLNTGFLEALPESLRRNLVTVAVRSVFYQRGEPSSFDSADLVRILSVDESQDWLNDVARGSCLDGRPCSWWLRDIAVGSGGPIDGLLGGQLAFEASRPHDGHFHSAMHAEGVRPVITVELPPDRA
jgi:hypothetical protein